MRARPAIADIAPIATQLAMTAGWARLLTLSDGFAALTEDTIDSILSEAARTADRRLAPLNDTADAQGCAIIDGRVRTAPGHRAAWDAFVEGGWTTLDQPEVYGGQGLPLALAAATQEIFDRACPAFGMLPVPQRSAAKLIAAHGDAVMQAEWLPHLISGVWGATICISEVEAGSDVGRIRTIAEPNVDGSWAITGEKCWISFGDHDLTPRIGHCLLARTPGAAPGGAGLSLFLVPDTIDDVRNAISMRRIEEKMGLHGSPTCALGFAGARGRMIGAEGRGLAQLFVMITNMRLSVGVQGLGIASACSDVAFSYAADRRQGGSGATPVPIAEHPDVQRQLLGTAARVAVLRGLVLAVAVHADLAAHETDDDAREDAAALLQWLLPIVKTTGGEFASECADIAIQVLGGAGYTREWPVEQAARDARVLTIFEGTTGIQSLDLLQRRTLRGDRRGYAVFLRLARAAAARSATLLRCLDRLEETVEAVRALDDPRAREAGATAFLHLAALAATGWIAAGLAALDPTDPTQRRLAVAGDHWLTDIDARAASLATRVRVGGEAISGFDAFH